MKSNKGITLVALVITIIVLLILAGVSISLVVGDNGIMTRAKTAGEKSGEADAKSTFELAVASIVSEYWEAFANGDSVTTPGDYVTKDRLSTELGNSGYSFVTGQEYSSSGTSCQIQDSSNKKYTIAYTKSSDGVPKVSSATLVK